MGLGGISEKHRVIKDDAENCPFVEYFKRYFITFQILFLDSQGDIFLLVNGSVFVCIYVWRGAKGRGKSLLSSFMAYKRCFLCRLFIF